MNGCDKADQMLSYYGHHQRKSVKWWKKIFYWLIELAQVNSFILFKLAKGCPKLTLKGYKTALISQLLMQSALAGDGSAPTRSVRRPSSTPHERLQGNIHLIDYHKDDRNCVVCSRPGSRKRTNYICVGCSDRPHLHPKTCFRIYHSKVNYQLE